MKWLVALHLLVGIAPLASFVLPASIWMLPALWALSALSIAQLMLLSVWVGISGHQWHVRLAGALLGPLYVSVWPVLSQFIPPHREYEMSLVKDFLFAFLSYASVVVVLSAAFVVMQRRGNRLIHASQLAPYVPSSRPQYSMFRLLALMSICSLVFSMMKVARPDDQALGTLDFVATAAIYILMFVTLLLTTICAVWATLGPPPPWSRIVATLGISLLLGIAVAIATGNYAISGWIFTAAALIPVVYTVAVVGSLLVVRSCGYRLGTAKLMAAAVER